MTRYEPLGCSSAELRCEYDKARGKYICEFGSNIIIANMVDITVQPSTKPTHIELESGIFRLPVRPPDQLCCYKMVDRNGNVLMLRCTPKHTKGKPREGRVIGSWYEAFPTYD